MEPDCIFCKIVKGEIESKKVYEDDNFFGILDNNPISEGHTLIIPKKHFETILDLPTELYSECFDMLKKSGKTLMEQIQADGFNVINNNFSVAGQIVPHLHFHIIPRRKINEK